MSRREPLVYLGRSAEERARRILGGCPEVEIAQAIVQGQLRFDDGEAFISGPGWQATARRTPGVLRPTPRAWTVTDVVARNTDHERGIDSWQAGDMTKRRSRS